MNPRKGAYRVLSKVLYEETYSNIALNEEIQKGDYKDKDLNLLTEIVYGTIEKLLTLNFGIDHFSKVKTKKMDEATRLILQIGAYQILFLDRVPDFAIANEAGKLARVYAKRSKGFINGILRNMIRRKEEISWPKKEANLPLYLSVNYSYPMWLVEELLKYYSAEFTEGFMKASAENPPMYFRVNTLKVSREKVLEAFKKQGLEAEISALLPEAIKVQGLKNISDFQPLKEGWVHIQDISSMFAAKFLDPRPGEYVMDLCSAPGGKTTHIAQLMENKGEIIARDIFPHKLRLIEEHSHRLGINIIKTRQFSGENLDKESIGKADRVLVDAPCSGLGVIRRKPEIKYRVRKEGLEALQKLQRTILENAAKYVKSGGVLLYSTCTIHPLENQGITEAFLKNHGDFVPVDLKEETESRVNSNLGFFNESGAVVIFPQEHQMDGFYIRKFQKQ
ncbi:16S rRNA (cytosine(967)-C(5))-methyltransferase RsmB [Isachenkonia alkalipeptolytica]|uniref:16S rRNA (cytosine(967)-C(5))-methyltransferase n=1 Tax=Isachenkonia alkalipeptolytica TaxID=2565777 RepID=A0AA44BEA8_9CLOT|nr:16S rRNA (cytosine(967)-C(5))-methyltransferase RsmB [Isachenkonia alkalipeptolytica]NBG89129.1 16S rRNA (cytosine(967)-C(5))-methyltransferase RsmB [Isachenkonia alkalipeptolytica]